MNLDRNTALETIFAAIDEFNATLDGDKQLERSAEAVIFGAGGKVDSLGLVNLIMSCEQHFYEKTGQEILLASEAAMSRRHSPFHSAGALADFAVEVANDGETQ